MTSSTPIPLDAGKGVYVGIDPAMYLFGDYANLCVAQPLPVRHLILQPAITDRQH
ncbi:MAG: hypothetical protein AAFQ95_16505 [Cyanobacteria bacterium J06621_3]